MQRATRLTRGLWKRWRRVKRCLRTERPDDLLYGPDPCAAGTGDRLGRPDFKLPDGHLRAAADGSRFKGGDRKGQRTQPALDAMKKYQAVYFAAIGGTGALIAKSIKKNEIIAYAELGAEAVLRLEVENFPVTVINDIYGGDLYRQGKAKYKISSY